MSQMMDLGISMATHLFESIETIAEASTIQDIDNQKLRIKEKAGKELDRQMLLTRNLENEKLDVSYSQQTDHENSAKILKDQELEKSDISHSLEFEKNLISSLIENPKDDLLSEIENSTSVFNESITYTQDSESTIIIHKSVEEQNSLQCFDSEPAVIGSPTEYQETFNTSEDSNNISSRQEDEKLSPYSTKAQKDPQDIVNQETIKVNANENIDQNSIHSTNHLRDEISGSPRCMIADEGVIVDRITTVDDSIDHRHELFNENIQINDDNSFVPKYSEHQPEASTLGRRNSSIMCVDLLGQYQCPSSDENVDLNQYFQNDPSLDFYQHQKEINIPPSSYNIGVAASTSSGKVQQQATVTHLAMQNLQIFHQGMDEVYKQQHQQYTTQQFLPTSDWNISNEMSTSQYNQQQLEYQHEPIQQQFYSFPPTLQPLHVESEPMEVLGENQQSNGYLTSNSEITASHQQLDGQICCHQDNSYTPQNHRNSIGQDDCENINSSDMIWVMGQQEMTQQQKINEEYQAHSGNLCVYYPESRNIPYTQCSGRAILDETSDNQQRPPHMTPNEANEGLTKGEQALPNSNNVYVQQVIENRVGVLLEPNTSYNHRNQRFSNVAKFDRGGELIEYRPLDTFDPNLLYPPTEQTCHMSTGIVDCNLSRPTCYTSSNGEYLYQHNTEVTTATGTHYLQPLQPSSQTEQEDIHEKTYHLMGQGKTANNHNVALESIYTPATEQIQDTLTSNRLELQPPIEACYNIPAQAQAINVPKVSQTYEPIEEISEFLFDNFENSSSSHDEGTDNSWSATATTSHNKYATTSKVKSKTSGLTCTNKEARCSQETLHKLRAYLKKKQTASMRAGDSLSVSSSSSRSNLSSLSSRSLNMGENNIINIEDNQTFHHNPIHYSRSPSTTNGQYRELEHGTNINDTISIENSSKLIDSQSPSTSCTGPLEDIPSSEDIKKDRSLNKEETVNSHYQDITTESSNHLSTNIENRQLRNRIIVINPQASSRLTTPNTFKSQDNSVDSYSLRTRTGKRRRLTKSPEFHSETDTSSS